MYEFTKTDQLIMGCCLSDKNNENGSGAHNCAKSNSCLLPILGSNYVIEKPQYISQWSQEHWHTLKHTIIDRFNFPREVLHILRSYIDKTTEIDAKYPKYALSLPIYIKQGLLHTSICSKWQSKFPLIKIGLFGDSKVGKKSILEQIVFHEFKENMNKKQRIDELVYDTSIMFKHSTFQTTFSISTQSNDINDEIIQFCDCFAIIYAANDPNSLITAKNIIQNIKSIKSSTDCCVLVCNKCDLINYDYLYQIDSDNEDEDENDYYNYNDDDIDSMIGNMSKSNSNGKKQVTFEQGIQLANTLNVPLVQTSAKTSANCMLIISEVLIKHFWIDYSRNHH